MLQLQIISLPSLGFGGEEELIHMKSYYIYTVQGETTGPHSTDEVIAMLKAKQLPTGTRICEVGEKTWHNVEEVFRPERSAPPKVATPPVQAAPPPYSAPQQPYGAPPPYGAPQQPYGAPPPYGAPQQPYGAPPSYGAPQQPYGAPPPYGAPQPPYGTPPPYGAPPQPYGAPPPYGAAMPEPMPNENWAAIAKSYWTFKGRIGRGAFLKSVLFGVLCQLVGMLLWVVSCGYGSIYRMPAVVLKHGEFYHIDYSTECDYLPTFLPYVSLLVILWGFIICLPPLARRLQDIGVHSAVIIVQVLVSLGAYIRFFCHQGRDSWRALEWYRYDGFWEVFGWGLLVVFGSWLITVYVLSFMRGKMMPNRFGPVPAPTGTPFLPFTNMLSRVFGVGLVLLIVVGFVVTFGINHGTQRELVDAVKDNDAAAVSASIKAGASPDVMHTLDGYDYYSMLALAIREDCSEAVFRALKDGGAELTSALRRDSYGKLRSISIPERGEGFKAYFNVYVAEKDKPKKKKKHH